MQKKAMAKNLKSVLAQHRERNALDKGCVDTVGVVTLCAVTAAHAVLCVSSAGFTHST
jgi:hypothetical protein